MEAVTGSQEEDLSKYQTDKGYFQRWSKEISLVQGSKARQGFERIGERIVKLYKAHGAVMAYSDASVVQQRMMFNVLWSNVQILKPMCYARMPNVVVERRHKDQDPIGRLAALGAERATSYMLDVQKDKFNFGMKAVVEDRLLPGLGQGWVRYSCEFQEAQDESGNPITDPNTGEAVRIPKPFTEESTFDYVYWQDYFQNIARTPFEVRWVARRTYQNRMELIKNFGEIGKKVKLSLNPGNTRQKMSQEEQEFLQQAEVFEIWDKDTKTVIWITEGYKEGCLKCVADPLKLKDFFPCPIPLLATTTTDSMIPTADYVIYEGLAEELDYIIKRKKALTDCIRMVGMAAASLVDKLKNVTTLKDGQLWPVDNWAGFVEKGGFKGVIDWLPFDKAVEALGPLSEQQNELMAQIDLITGIPDIVRGATDANETAAAQQRKSHWVTAKNQYRAEDVQRFCRDVIGKMAEIIFEPGLFSDETIAQMVGVNQMSPEDQQNWPLALQLLRDDRLQTFRVDIETDSTIAADEEEDRAAWFEYMEVMQKLVGEIEAVTQYQPDLMGPIIESAKAATRRLKAGRAVEGAWDNAWTKIEDKQKQMEENPPEPQPDPQMLKAQTDQMKAQGEIELNQRKQMFTEWLEPQKLQAENQANQMKFAIDSQKVQIDGMAVQSKTEHEKMQAELEVFMQKFNQFVAQQELAIEAMDVTHKAKSKESELALKEKIASVEMMFEQQKLHVESANHKLSIYEKLLEEKRLAKEEHFKTKEMGLREKEVSLKEEELDHKKAEAGRERKKSIKIKRTPEGYEGESRE